MWLEEKEKKQEIKGKTHDAVYKPSLVQQFVNRLYYLCYMKKLKP